MYLSELLWCCGQLLGRCAHTMARGGVSVELGAV